MEDKLYRVKVYVMMEDKQWKDIGAGQISSKYIDRLQGVCLLVHSESDGSPILECKIQPNVPYQKHQGKVIIWSEAKNHGTAIHFQEPNDCQETWEVICQVQGKDPNVEITQLLTDDLESFKDMLLSWNKVEMSSCELHTLENIADLLSFVNEAPSHKKILTLVLEKEGYIKKLLQLFKTCEKHQNIDGLHYLNNIIRGILFLDNIHLFNIMFSDEFIMDVVGCLEYGPGLDEPKQHRQFLTQNVKFKNVMQITHSQLRKKIQQTYRMQYIYDIVLPTPSIFEVNLLHDLSTMIFFNKIEIITMLQEDEHFLLEVLAQLKDNTVSNERRHELLLFFKEFCAFAKTLHFQKKNTLLKTLIKLGIISALKVVVHMHDYQIQVAALELFAHLVEYSPRLIRAYAMKEAQYSEDNDGLLINIMIKQMTCDSDPEFSRSIILTTVLHAILDPENMRVTTKGHERRKFLNYFYRHCMNKLIEPILSITVENNSDDNRVNICPDNYQNAQLLGAILEILTFCVQYHSKYVKNYIISKNLLSRILILMSSKHTFLILCAVRFMRKMIGLKDKMYNLYIVEKNLFEPVVNAFMHNGHRYNMLNSAIIELFEFIRQENIKSLIANIVEKFFMFFESIQYVQTFKGLKTKYEEEKKKKRERQLRKSLHNIIYQRIYCRHIKAMEVKVKADIFCRQITDKEEEREKGGGGGEGGGGRGGEGEGGREGGGREGEGGGGGKGGRGEGGAVLSMGSDIPSHYDMFVKINEMNERENVIECRKRKSSATSEYSTSCGDTSDNGISTVYCSSLVPLVDYAYDTDGEDDDGSYGNNENEEEEEEEEEEEPPKKKPYFHP